MATAYHARRPSHGAAVDDTPTRPSSAAASFSSNLTSLKPPRTAAAHQQHGTKPSLSGLTSRAGAGLAAVDLNRLDARGTAPRPNSRNSALKASDLDGLADGADPNYIEADNTELARRRAEASFQREMQDLRNAAISPSSASDISLGPKQQTNNNSRESDTHLRRQFDDETASSHSRTSASSYESFRIGLAAAPQLAATGESNSRRYQDHHDDEDDDDLTYVTLARTDMTSPAKTATPARPSPVAATAPAPAPTLRANTSTAAPATNLFASPRPFVTAASAGATLSAARVPSYPQASSPRPAPAQTNENQPPPFSSYANRPSPVVKSFPTAAAPSQPPRASPFSTVNPALSSFRTAGPPPPLAGTPQSAMPHRPSPLGRNSPILAASPTATSTPTGGSRSYISRGGGAPMSAAAAAGDRTTMTALPDRTGITDFLRSPERERQIYERERQRSATAAEERGRSSPAQPLGASTKTAESNLAAQALASLTSKLAALERDNANSAARVAELEARLAATTAERERGRGQSQSDDRQLEEEARRVRREVEILLGDERARREDLERVVASLRAQNAHLDATLSAQKQTLDALRVSRTAAPATAAARNPQPEPYALRSEVQDLKHALAALGYEVDGVRTVVEELLREKEERDAGKKWEAEEAERRADLQAQAQAQAQARQPFASDDSIGATPPLDRHDAQVEDSVRSWVSQEEVEMLKREQREEAERQRRGMATTTVKPTAPRAHVKHDSSIRSSQDPTYVPSATASSAELSEASYVSVTSATTDSFSSFSSAAVDEPDFARAERIFASAPADTHRARRRSSSRQQQQQRRSSGEHAPGSKRRVDRVVLVEEPSVNLCTNCHGRKETLKHTSSRPRPSSGSKVAAAPRARDDGAEADEEDLAPVDEARERRKREHKAEKVRREQERVERGARKERERKVREREEHRRTLEDVLDRLEEEFSVQKKIYLELTAEYQSMSSRAQTAKRRALATHLKKSIDVLEDKARDVKRYADALEDMYEAVHDKTCPQRKLHGFV
ncbi:hypothetical protein C6P46_003284 [Rhodotorula mucilaginosa]|uniref:Cep57 centrosome microtubule-binding domain-containing protein n=1 Tax=Rhodotorula mucilaginosa TaxID=5537 RepID=A0A9P6W4Q1_RHOMI|nr:hypothetical protein C6P46_003284 [Rhodotorula mucilaginosa]